MDGEQAHLEINFDDGITRHFVPTSFADVFNAFYSACGEVGFILQRVTPSYLHNLIENMRELFLHGRVRRSTTATQDKYELTI